MERSSGEMAGCPKTPQQAAAQRRLQQTQAEVDEVVGIMRMNVEKVIERDQNLIELGDRAHTLQHGSSIFHGQTGDLRGKFWLTNMKMLIILGIIALIIILLIWASYEYNVDSAAADRNIMSIVFKDSEHNTKAGESGESKNITAQEQHKSKSTTSTPFVLEEDIDAEKSRDREKEDFPANFPGSMTVLDPPNRKSGRKG